MERIIGFGHALEADVRTPASLRTARPSTPGQARRRRPTTSTGSSATPSPTVYVYLPLTVRNTSPSTPSR